MIAFHVVESIYIVYICFFSCVHLREYVLLKKLSHSQGLLQLMGVARKRMHAQALQTIRKKAACSYMYM